MEKRIREMFNDSILVKAMERYGIGKDKIRSRGGHESFIYEYDKAGKSYILRISHSSFRTEAEIGCEIDWLNYLTNNGVSASRAVASENGKWIQVIPTVEDTDFLAVSFEKAKGRHSRKEDEKADLFRKLGRIVGRMHALTKDYKPSHPKFYRSQWHQDWDGFAEKYLPLSDTIIIRKFNELREYLHTLPKDKDSYGLVHIDVHGGNYFVSNGEITLFDFAECQYAWFAYDIAMPLFYAVPHHCESKEDLDFARYFFDQFMAGYRIENSIDPKWLKQIRHFLKLREIDLYVLIHKIFDLNNLDKWCQSFMKNRKYKIENDIPYIDIELG